MKRRFPAIVLCLLLICSVFNPISLGGYVKNIPYQPISNIRGNWLYVGGEGPDNYTKIQDAIDNASKGDTVYVYDDSSPYYENVKIYNKYYLNLIGENMETTIIDGSGIWQRDVVVLGGQVSINGFTIKNSGNWDLDAGIYCQGGGNKITGNKILNNKNGINTWDSIENIITDNLISNNDLGIMVEYRYNHIYHNNFINNTINAYSNNYNDWDDGRYGNYWDDYKEKYPDAKKHLLRPWMWDTPYTITNGVKDRCPLTNQWPESRPRTITRDTTSSSSFWFSFMDMFPILQRILGKIL